MTTKTQDGSGVIPDVLASFCTVGGSGDTSSTFLIQSGSAGFLDDNVRDAFRGGRQLLV